MQKNAIAFCFDKNYAKYCQVAILSLLISNGSCFRIYCLHTDDVDLIDLDNINEIGLKFCVDINLIKANNDVLKNFQIHNHFTFANYLRLLLPEFLSEDKVLYLDSDIIINRSIAEIFEIEMLNDKYLGVFDLVGSKTTGLDQKFKEKYINSGVLMMNLSALKKDNSFEKMKLLYNQNYEKIKWADQCLINLYAHKSIRLIDDRFNFQIFSNEISKDDWSRISSNKIVYHFVGKYKPWHKCSRIHISEFWWGYAKLLHNDRIKPVSSSLVNDLIIETKSLEEYGKFEDSCKIKDKIISGLIDHIQIIKKLNEESTRTKN